MGGVGDQGCLRSNMVVSDLTVSAYPSGTKFAYGVSSDEQFTLTATHTQKYADRDNETFDLISTNSIDTAVETFLDVEVGAATTTSQAFIVDDTYTTGDNNHGFRFTVNNNGILLTTEKWSLPIASGANVTQDGTDSVKRSSFYVVNPDVTIGSPTLGQNVYNRDETATLTVGVSNARGQSLTRSVTLQVKDGGGTVKKTITDTGPVYGDGGTSDYLIGSSDRATYDLVGDQWTLNGLMTGARFANTQNAYKVSRMWLFDTSGAASITPSAANKQVFTDKITSPGSDLKTTFNRGQPAFFNSYIYNVRGQKLTGPTTNFNVRPTATEVFEESNDVEALVSGQFTGAGATYTVDVDESTGGKCLVVASTATGSDQPRTGTGGSGNFAETNTATAEWVVSSTYTLLTRTQKLSTRNANAQDTQFTIGEDVIYCFAEVRDFHGDVVQSATVDFTQRNPNDALTQTQTGFVSGSDGWTASPGAAFDTRAPSGPNWIMRSAISNHNGNTGTDDQSITMLSAFTANKNIIPSFGAVPGVPNTLGLMASSDGNHFKRGDLGLSGLALLVGGVRSFCDVPPEMLFAQFDFNIKKVVVLQNDGTWQPKTDSLGAPNPLYVEDADGRPYFFPCKFTIEGGLEWLVYFGTAAQIQATGIPPGLESNYAYIMDTGSWPSGKIYTACHVVYNGQDFYDDEWSDNVASSRQHPYGVSSLPETNVIFNATAGHTHNGVDSSKSKTFFDPTGNFA